LIKYLYTEGYNFLSDCDELLNFYEEYYIEQKENLSIEEFKIIEKSIKSILLEFSKREDILANYKINNFFRPVTETRIFRSLLVF
jgi:hypothetical protein